jgi:hypothetical protein
MNGKRISIGLAATIALGLIQSSAFAGPLDEGGRAAASQTRSTGRVSIQSHVMAEPAFSSTDPGCTPAGVTQHEEGEGYIGVNPANPGNLVGVWMQGQESAGGAWADATAATFDGGATWQPSIVPQGTTVCGETPGKYVRNGDGWISFGADGTAYLVSHMAPVTANGSGDPNRRAEMVSVSHDGGATWGDPVAAFPLDANGASITGRGDKPSITADPNRPGVAYVVHNVDRLSMADQTLWFASTHDGGATWSDPVQVHARDPRDIEIGGQIGVLPSGELVISYAAFQGGPWLTAELTAEVAPTVVSIPYSVGLAYSTDEGQTWDASTPVYSGTTTVSRDPGEGQAGPGQIIWPSETLPSLAVAQDGSIDLAWTEAQTDAGSMSGRIRFARGTLQPKGGFSWTHSTVTPTSAQAFLPAVAVRQNGEIGVLYYDLREDTVDPAQNVLSTDVWLAYSNDDGGSWNEAKVAGPFDARRAVDRSGLGGAAPGWCLGDYFGMVAAGSSFDALYLTTKADPDDPSDIVFSRIRT